MEEEECGCQINNTKEEFLFQNKDTVGEEIFEDDDIFNQVKNYYQNFSKDEGDYLEDDLLLDDLNPKKDDKIIRFINDLNNAEYNKVEEIVIKKEDNFNKIILPKETQKIYSEEKERKVKYIKDYLEKLKKGNE